MRGFVIFIIQSLILCHVVTAQSSNGGVKLNSLRKKRGDRDDVDVRYFFYKKFSHKKNFKYSFHAG